MGEEAHDLNLADVDAEDEISGDERPKLVWCNTHGRYEWHWVPR